MRQIGRFITGAGGWAMGSNFASFIFYIVGLITLGKYGSSITVTVMLAISVPLCWIGAFLAWKKLDDKLTKGNRPSIAPRSYKKREDGRFGLTVTNSEYAGFNVHIPNAPIGESGYVLQFDGIFSELLPGEHALFETWLENRNGLPGRGGGDLYTIMQEMSLRFVYFGIISKDTSPTPNWYRDNCSFECNNQKHRTGLVLKHIDQNRIPEPPE